MNHLITNILVGIGRGEKIARLTMDNLVGKARKVEEEDTTREHHLPSMSQRLARRAGRTIGKFTGFRHLFS